MGARVRSGGEQVYREEPGVISRTVAGAAIVSMAAGAAMADIVPAGATSIVQGWSEAVGPDDAWDYRSFDDAGDGVTLNAGGSSTAQIESPALDGDYASIVAGATGGAESATRLAGSGYVWGQQAGWEGNTRRGSGTSWSVLNFQLTQPGTLRLYGYAGSHQPSPSLSDAALALFYSEATFSLWQGTTRLLLAGGAMTGWAAFDQQLTLPAGLYRIEAYAGMDIHNETLPGGDVMTTSLQWEVDQVVVPAPAMGIWAFCGVAAGFRRRRR